MSSLWFFNLDNIIGNTLFGSKFVERGENIKKLRVWQTIGKCFISLISTLCNSYADGAMD